MDGAQILVVDDEPQLLRLMARVLERDGHMVHVAPGAAEALQLLDEAQVRPALAVLDQNGLGAAAEDLLRALRARLPDLHILLMSGGEVDPSLAAALRAAGGRFLRKPFSPRQLSHAVSQVLSGDADPALA